MAPARSRPTLLAAALAAAALAAGPAAAWTPRTRARMVDEAVTLLPASLRLALEHHRDPLLRGALEGMAHEDAPSHRPAAAGGSLENEIAHRSDALVRAIRTSRSFDDIARAFGELAHAVQDAGFPPNGSPEGGPHYRHFSDFVESRSEKIPLVFYGHGDEDLARGDAAAFARRMVADAREQDGRLARVYAVAGDPPDPAAFDDRSIPFAIASLSYSRTVTDVVRAWLSAWERAHGDLHRTPYREPSRERP